MSVRALPFVLVLAALVAGPPAGTAEEAAEPAPEGQGEGQGAAEGGPLLHGKLELTLEDAIGMGIENNLDVEVERYSPLIADYDSGAAWGAYDPVLFAEGGYRDLRSPNSSQLTGQVGGEEPGFVTERMTDGEVGLRGAIPFIGGSYSAKFDSQRRNSLSVAFESLDPEYRSAVEITAQLPLLKNLIWNEPWTQIRTTRIRLAGSQEEFRRAVMDVVQSIEDAYWTLIAREEALRVAQKSLETTRALLEQTQTQYEVGVVSKVEVTEAEAGLAQRQVELIRARNQYRNQQDVLIDRVLGPNLRAASTLEIRPTDRPGNFVPYEVDVEAAVQRAFASRPELAAADYEVERREVQLQFAKNQRLPELDAQVTYRTEDLSGDASGNSLFGPPTITDGFGGYGDSTDDFFVGNKGDNWILRGLFSIPIPNRAARNTAAKREIEFRRANTQKRRLEQQVIVEVRQAARNLLASQEGIVAARSAQRAAEEQLRAEEIRLEYGESTPFEVLQREEDLVARERQLIDAYQGYRTSVTALDRAQGTILRNRNIKIAEVATLR